MTGHDPDWPQGLCAGCGLVWPCEQVMAVIVDKYGLGLPFAAELWRLFDQAARAVPAAPFLVLYEQCIRQPMRYANNRDTEGNRWTF